LALSVDTQNRLRARLIPSSRDEKGGAWGPTGEKWQDAIQKEDRDLAWRLLCVQRLRQEKLPPYAEQFWQLGHVEESGQRGFVPLTLMRVEQILGSYPKAAQDLLRGYLQILPVISPFLSSEPQKGFELSLPWQATRRVLQKQNPWMLRHRVPLLSWLPYKTRKKESSLSEGPLVQWVPWWLPVPSHELTILAAIVADGLGYSRWNWQGKTLQQQVVPLMKPATRLWRSLSSAQRGGLLLISKVGKDVAYEQVEAWMASFLLRCLLVLTQRHTELLETLRAGHAPSAWIADLEAWMVSPVYGQIRAESPYEFQFEIPPLLREGLC